MINKIDHIGIAVKNLTVAIPKFNLLLGTEPYKTEIVDSEKVSTVFYRVGDCKIELLCPTSKESTIYKFLEKKGEGIHHIAFDVYGIQKSLDFYASRGINLIHNQPKIGADKKEIAFLHPKDTLGVLIELCADLINDK